MAVAGANSVTTGAGTPSATSRALPRIDFLTPAGAPALYAADSISWRIYKNPVSLFIGGIAAVLLELAEPRVRSGVWGHSIFPTDPLNRIRRTGLMTHVTIYAPAATAERAIRSVVKMHSRVEGETPDGAAYHANDPELLDWVQATVGYGFIGAYHAYGRRLSAAEFDQAYAESRASAHLFGATGAPLSVAEQQAQFEVMRPRLESHAIVHDFLNIISATPALPPLLRPLQKMMVRAGVELLPGWLVERLELGPEWRLKPWEARLLKRLGAAADRIPIPGIPPVQACQRMGLSAAHLYRR